MSFNVHIGAWIVPVLITIGLFVWSLWERPGDRGGFIPDLTPLFRLAGAIIVSLVVWVIYLSVRLGFAS